MLGYDLFDHRDRFAAALDRDVDDLAELIDIGDFYAGDARGDGIDVARHGDIDDEERLRRAGQHRFGDRAGREDEVRGTGRGDDDIGFDELFRERR